MSSPLANTNLFKSIKVGQTTLQNRLAFAPATRMRATDDFKPTNIMKTYYEDRARNNGGLLVTEGVFVSEQAGFYPNVPMLETEDQVKGWKKITDAVHEQGSFISLQLWNLGRLGVAGILKAHGKPLLGASAIYENPDAEKNAKEAGNELREMTIEEIEQAKKDYVEASKKALNEAGFDFVEIHAATMYLPNQFLDPASNKRTDKYGGSIENRSRFILELVDELSEAVGADKVGIRLSPYLAFQGSEGANSKILHPIAQYSHLISELEKRGRDGKRLAYLHSIEARIAEPDQNDAMPDYSSEWIDQIWEGILMKNGSYLHDKGYHRVVNEVNRDERTIISAARYFVSTPDLAFRLKNNYELNPYDRSTFYGPATNQGYNTYPEYNKTVDELVGEVESVAL